MPTSPMVRISPGRELRAENHKRRHSLESGILHREKEDDLALFNEVQNKERENFLLQSNDNFDDMFSTKLRYFSDHKLGISVTSRGESSDLLNAEGDKNDYDWLITPPETPLFRSLDDEAPQVNLALRDRPRSQPVPILRSPTMEKGHKSSRGSASPHRLSPSPNPSKPFSVTHSSPPPTTRYISPSRGLSPPPRYNTPPPRRIISGSSGTTPPSRARGTSPVKTSRGNSASPKIKAWQSNIPGFSSEAPSNLRTSLADRPASYVRGSSPASRNERKPMSPTATSRSVGSSYSKGSVVSSGDDDLDSLQSAPRGVGVYPSNGAVSFSKKPTNSMSSSAPKRSVDLVRQMDRKCPQNMFRPLLSSVPSSTFYAGNSNSRHYSRTSRNSSSITTSSHASSDLATSGAHDTKGSEQNQEDTTSDRGKEHYSSYVDDEVFVMDQVHDINEDIENKIVGDPLGSRNSEIDGPSKRDAMDTSVTVMDMKNDYSDANGLPPDMVICSKCGLIFHSTEVVIDGDLQFCRECKSLEVNSTITNPVEILDRPASNTESIKVNESQHSCSESSQNLFSIMPTEEKELSLATQQVIKHLQHDGVNSNSIKGHIVESRSFTASNTSYDDFSYTRDSVNSMKSSISASVSSSVDLGFSRQTEGQIYRQLSGQKSDMENYRYEIPNMHKRSVSTSCHEDGFEEFEEKTSSDPCEQSVASESLEAESTCTNIENNIIFKTQEPASHENKENLTNNYSNSTNVQTFSAQSETSIQEEDAGPPSSCADRVNISEVPNPGSLDAISEIVIENADVVSDDSHSDVGSNDSKRCVNELRHDEDITDQTVEEFDISQHAHHVVDESRILLEDTGETKPRSLTLEEATDAILFCSSIVHNLAYEAANIAINNKTLPREVLRPTLTFVGKPDSERRDNTRSRTVRKRNSKSQKARQKRPEMDTKPPSCNAETDENSSPRNNVDSLKPPKLESKCNCVIM